MRIFSAVMIVLCSAAFASAATEDEARDLYRLGSLYYEQGRYQDAEDMFKKALELLEKKEKVSKKTPAAVAPSPPAPATGKPSGPAVSSPASASPEYLIDNDDILRVSVWQNPDLDQDCVVRPDGRISFPLVGDIVAKGLTLPRLDEEITTRLAEFVRQPEVSISIKKMGGSKIVILGEVKEPGIYNVSGAKTVFEAIAMAGGQNSNAVLSSVIVIRDVLGSPQAKRVNLVRMMKGKNLGPDLMLRPEDVVFVPKKFIADLNYFLGQIVEPIAKGAFVHHELSDW